MGVRSGGLLHSAESVWPGEKPECAEGWFWDPQATAPAGPVCPVRQERFISGRKYQKNTTGHKHTVCESKSKSTVQHPGPSHPALPVCRAQLPLGPAGGPRPGQGRCGRRSQEGLPCAPGQGLPARP